MSRSNSHRWELLLRVIIRPECVSDALVYQRERNTALAAAGRLGKVPDMRTLYITILACFLASTSSAADFETYTWLDGDTVKGGGHTYRLAAIDCPESDQPGGEAAAHLAARWADGKVLRMYIEDTDRYGRHVAHVCIDGSWPPVCVNDLLVEAGLCWVYEQYASDADKQTLLPLQKHARNERLGLWSEANPIPPWEWRRGKR